MSLVRLSNIPPGTAPALTDTVIGVQGGSVDAQYTLAQIASSVASGYGSGIWVAPTDVGSLSVANSAIKSINGSSGTPALTDPPSPNIVAQLWSGVADANTMTTAILGSVMKQSSSTVAWCTGVVGSAQDNVGGNFSFCEGIRGTARLVGGTHGAAYGIEGVVVANPGTLYHYLIANEGETVNNSGVDAPVYTSLTSTPSTLSVNYIASCNGSNKSDYAFMTNPFNTQPFRAGIVIAPGTIDSTGAAFVNWSSCTVGLDLSQGSPTYSSYQILGVNGFAVAGNGQIATPGVNASSFINTPEIFLGGGTASFPQIIRSGTVAKFRLADNSADCPITTGYISTPAPTTKTSNYSATDLDVSIIFNGAGSLTLTLQAASSYSGRWMTVKTIAAQTVVSATSNVVPLVGGAAGTAILAGTAGKWARLQSDGTNWIVMEGN